MWPFDQAFSLCRLLEEEWPDESEITAARIKEREAAVPVPERVWALRNVAGTLSLGGPGERLRARRLLEQAVMLKESWLESAEHPGASSSQVKKSILQMKRLLSKMKYLTDRRLFSQSRWCPICVCLEPPAA